MYLLRNVHFLCYCSFFCDVLYIYGVRKLMLRLLFSDFFVSHGVFYLSRKYSYFSRISRKARKCRCFAGMPYGVWNYSTTLFQLIYSISTLWFYLSWSTARFFVLRKNHGEAGMPPRDFGFYDCNKSLLQKNY